jgi:cobalamin synthase
MLAAAVARRGGAGWLVTLLLAFAALFAIHPPPVGPAALVCFAVAAVLIERWNTRKPAPEPTSLPPSGRLPGVRA